MNATTRPSLQPAAADRAARLKRMRAAATGLLVVMAALYVLASVGERRWPALAWVRAFAEAASVGGAADWFAVTALFRRPFGLPIPHTAIIPRGKDRIGGALGRFIVENFLKPSVLDAKLRQAELAAWGGDWLRRPGNAQALAHRVLQAAPGLIAAMPEGALGEVFGSVALSAARAVPAAPTASALLARVWSEGRAQALVDRGAELIGGYLSEHQEVILKTVQGQSWRWMPSFVDRAIAAKVTDGLIGLLADVRQADHPWRARLGEVVEEWIDRLAHDPVMRERGEALKTQLLADPRLAAQAARLGAEIRRRLEAGDLADGERLRERLAALLQGLGARLAEDVELQRTLNTAARALVRKGLAPRRHAIGGFVAQVVAGWDARDIVERLELLVGPDLQYIRINGAVVGGLVGLLLYAVSRLARLA